MGVLSQVISDLVPYTLQEELDHREAIEDETERAAYRPTVFYLRPATPDQAAAHGDSLLAGAVHRASLLLVRENLSKIQDLRMADGSRVTLEKGPGTDLVSHLKRSWVSELAQKLDSLANLEDSDFA